MTLSCSVNHVEQLSCLKIALEVLDERDHLGLDEDMANRLKAILLRQIAGMEAQLQRQALMDFSPEASSVFFA